MKFRHLFALGLGIFLLSACGTGAATQTPSGTSFVETTAEASQSPAPTTGLTPTTAPPDSASSAQPFSLNSPAFAQGESIPSKYSCDGEDVSPPLAWGEPPTGTQSLALIMDDPDAPIGTWDHWILFNIPPDMRELQENLPITGKNVDPDAIYIGNNSWGRPDYGGPCPPSGTHRYFFKLYALDTTLNLLPGAKKQEILDAMEGHILAEVELMGTYNH